MSDSTADMTIRPLGSVAVGEDARQLKGLIAILAFVYVVVSFGLSGLPSVSRLSIIAAALLAACLLISRTRLPVPGWLLPIVALYLYLIIPALALPIIPWVDISTATTVLLGTSTVALALCSGFIGSNVVVYGMLLAAVANLCAVLLGIDTTPAEYATEFSVRATGFLGNANTLSVNMLLPGLAIWLFPERFPRTVRVVAVLVGLYGVYVSGSRKGVILTAAIIFLAARHRAKSWSVPHYLLAGCTVAFLACVFFNSFSGFIDLLQNNVSAIGRIADMYNGDEASFSERKWLLETAYQIWQHAPLFGEGLGQFAVIGGGGLYSHNNYTELLVSGGVVGAVLYLIPYLQCAANAYRRNRSLLLEFLLVLAVLISIDCAMVSFLSRQIMLFLAYILFESWQARRPPCGVEAFTMPRGNSGLL